eukprot:2489858-Rhodomonas_salina.1
MLLLSRARTEQREQRAQRGLGGDKVVQSWSSGGQQGARQRSQVSWTERLGAQHSPSLPSLLAWG